MIKNSNNYINIFNQIIEDTNSFILQLKKDIVHDPLNNREKINQLCDSIKFKNSILRQITR